MPGPDGPGLPDRQRHGPPDAVGITQAAVDTILAHTRSEHPRECCGLLIGTPQAILEAVPVENAAADPFRHYEIPPEAYVAQLKRCRQQGGAVVGGYHSHPRSAPEPSPTDVEMAFAEFIFLIAGEAAAGTDLALRAYVFRDQEFVEVTLAVM